MKGGELLFNNLLLAVGLPSVFAGCYLISLSLALIVFGVLCAGVAIIKGLRNAEPRG